MASFNELINKNEPVLVDFFATWCGPCKMVPPILDELKKNVGNKISIIKIDVDKNQKLAAKFKIRSIPTLVLFKHGKVVWQKSGVVQANELEKAASKYY